RTRPNWPVAVARPPRGDSRPARRHPASAPPRRGRPVPGRHPRLPARGRRRPPRHPPPGGRRGRRARPRARRRGRLP
ncbi:hypothetical protein B1R27_17285, partial [Streptomyces sp. GKU 895]